MSSDQNQRILQIQSVFQAGAFQTVFLASCINLPKMAHHQRSQLAFTTCPCKAAPGLLAYCGWESSCFPSSREPGSLEIKAKHACNYLQSLQRLTSGLLSEERTCQQKPADQKFRQQKEGRRRGGVIHTKHSFTLIYMIFVSAQSCLRPALRKAHREAIFFLGAKVKLDMRQDTRCRVGAETPLRSVWQVVRRVDGALAGDH